MERFTIFAETPCETLQKLREKGITGNSGYINNLEAACDQKMQPATALSSSKNSMKIIGISTAIIGLITTLIIINKKK